MGKTLEEEESLESILRSTVTLYVSLRFIRSLLILALIRYQQIYGDGLGFGFQRVF